MTEQSGPIRVLYVEDDPGAARLLEKRLTRAGYAVDLAGNGDQGLAAWQAGSYDVLAVDHDLPGRTGLEIIADLAARGPLPPTVMITGRGSEAIAVEAMMLGADDYIIKDSESYYLDLIPTRIQRALNRKRLLEEKRLAEEDALRARDEWERTFDAVEDLLVILDTEHTIVRGNQAAALRLGLTKEELVGKTCYTLFHGTQSPPDFCPCPKMLATGNKSEEVIEEEKLRGIFHITAAPLRDGEGTIIGCVHVARDITENKKAEQALRKSEQRYRTLFEQSMDAIVMVHPDGEIIDCNPACAELFAASREEIVGADIRQFYWNPDERAALRADIEQKGFVKEFEWKMRRKDGVHRTCLVTSSAWRNQQGEVVGFLSVVRDVTDARRLEEQLLQSQKMEAVGTLAGGIAHDFNNLLQVIQGYADVALFDVKDGQPGHTELQEIKGAARNAAELTQGLLTFSRRVESRLRPTNLNQELEHVGKMLRRTIPRMIDVRLNLAQGLHTIHADPAQVQQLVMNIAVNARDAMPTGGELIIHTENVFLDESLSNSHLETGSGDYVLLTISDNGLGMDRDTAEHMFEPFFTTKEPGRGTGLGLAIAYGIVKNHNGHIECFSEPKTGTAFRIYFPARVEGRLHEKVTQQEPAVGGNEAVLLVDDEESVRSIGEKILSRYGYNVLTASNGREALQIFRRQRGRISLVILDLIMPGMGGKECMEAILRIDPAAKILVASGYLAEGQIEESLRHGARAAIKKPYGVDQMLQTIRQVLNAKEP